MFTGIIEEIGTVEGVQQSGESFVLTIKAKKVLGDVQLGDSIAVNGVCLTVTRFSKDQFSVDVMPETVKATSLKTVKRGSPVNLERAMAAGGRFGGHFLSGHVDGIGVISSKKPFENAVYYEIEADPGLLKHIILKGSIAVDGTSLTVFGVTENSFTISLIPHTMKETILGTKGPGEIVNLETDMIGKYVSHFLSGLTNTVGTRNTRITEQFLEENGFK
ncbi:riboflavin synthase [Bacillota bacterium Lsc_1132]